MNSTLHTSDCLTLLRTLPDNSIDNIITDPPYALGFMGKTWDASLPTLAIWQECLRVAKPGAHLLAFGGTRTYHRLTCAIEDAGWEIVDCVMWMHGQGFPKGQSCLKPSYEPIVLARKKASHVTPLNIDACRIAGASMQWEQPRGMGFAGGTDNGTCPSIVNTKGRWPANVILSEQAGKLLDAQSGISKSTGGHPKNAHNWFPKTGVTETANIGGLGDTGGASRFFYCAKSSKSEREQGCEELADATRLEKLDTLKGSPLSIHNTHPTVKPLQLMRYLTRLVAVSGSIVLDPFLGSGTTGMAAAHEQCHFIGCDSNPEYVTIAHCRIDPIVSASLI